MNVINCGKIVFSENEINILNLLFFGKTVSKKISKIISKLEEPKMSYTPSYQITDKILSLVAEISEKISKINERTNFVSKPHLRKKN